MLKYKNRVWFCNPSTYLSTPNPIKCNPSIIRYDAKRLKDTSIKHNNIHRQADKLN